ncbi:Fic family protein [Prosthecobacter sp.]|uniref:type II toxin-antitoxin system death-on-curing family toxin n=1 Tax=Prosthecobacter sp. TaxID=1965333 RepID=UPI002489F8DC|nr:Fic family protein [Prosthecobacter sp.]MDI1314991.1 Fic family protein [Prosthecobacter sp.]
MSQRLLHPPVDAVLAIHAEVLAAHGGSPALRSRDLLESALAAPQAALLGTPVISDPIEIAAAYLFYLCRNDAFLDANKPAALATCLVFLSENGLLKSDDLDADDWENLTLETTAGILNRDEVTQKLRHLVS